MRLLEASRLLNVAQHKVRLMVHMGKPLGTPVKVARPINLEMVPFERCELQSFAFFVTTRNYVLEERKPP